jgi:hypothetical protein
MVKEQLWFAGECGWKETLGLVIGGHSWPSPNGALPGPDSA